jgi:hypothetical protein
VRRPLVWIPCFLLLAAGAAPASAGAADAAIRGKGARAHHRHSRHPIVVVRDDFPSFGSTEPAPQVVIEVEGDVEITQLPDGSVHIVIERGEDDEEDE